MNLIFFMIDAVSRNRFYRKMEEMANYLEYLNNTGKYEVFQFFRLISNGLNTEFNTRAMFTGSQLRKERRGRPYWDLFSNQGNMAAFINGFCEDWMSYFTKIKFAGLDHAVFYPWCHFEFHPLENTMGNFAGPNSISRRCINGKHVHDHIFEYSKDIWENYSPYGKIIHISFQEGHVGTGEVINTLSPSMEKFFKMLEDTKELDDTIVILTSDHGLHMGPYFSTSDMGRFEEKLPLLLMIFPTKFLAKYPSFKENLRKNEQKLVSHYDTYWTLRHLATFPEFGGEIIENFIIENWHQEVWDCKINQKYMEIALMFQQKSWRKDFYKGFVDKIYTRIKKCFKELNITPKVHENVINVDINKINDFYSNDKFFVNEVIMDLDTLYWFEDAYQDINKNYFKGENVNIYDINYEKYIRDNLEAEKLSWNTLEAPGRGRYLFGRSLLKYSDDRTCEKAGIVHCVCKEKSKKNMIISRIG